jgi:hypothetical protein
MNPFLDTPKGRRVKERLYLSLTNISPFPYQGKGEMGMGSGARSRNHDRFEL